MFYFRLFQIQLSMFDYLKKRPFLKTSSIFALEFWESVPHFSRCCKFSLVHRAHRHILLVSLPDEPPVKPLEHSWLYWSDDNLSDWLEDGPAGVLVFLNDRPVYRNFWELRWISQLRWGKICSTCHLCWLIWRRGHKPGVGSKPPSLFIARARVINVSEQFLCCVMQNVWCKTRVKKSFWLNDLVSLPLISASHSKEFAPVRKENSRDETARQQPGSLRHAQTHSTPQTPQLPAAEPSLPSKHAPQTHLQTSGWNKAILNFFFFLLFVFKAMCEDLGLTDAEKVYAECGQQCPLSWEECILPQRMKRCVKIGEGTFGEVFSTTNAAGEMVALKVCAFIFIPNML